MQVEQTCRIFHLELPYPPTVNNYTTVSRGRKILSEKGRAYKDEAELLLMQQVHNPVPLEGPLKVYIQVYVPDRRRRDMDNILKPILDQLGENGFYEDDSQVDDIQIQRMGIQKPGCVFVAVSEIPKAEVARGVFASKMKKFGGMF